MPVILQKARLEDSARLYALQIAAFKPLLDKYGDYATNPGAEKPERTISRLQEPFSHFYFIRLGEKEIGALRVVDKGELCLLKQIFILPEYQGNGYAQQAIQLAEALHPSAKRWELDTIKQEAKLCHLYEKMGYRQTGQEPIQPGMTLVYYRK